MKDIEQNIYEGDIPFTYIKGLLRFLKSTPQPFNLIQLQAYLYTIHPLSWYEGLLDEAVRYSFIKLVRDNGSITAKITTDLYVGVRFMLSKPLDKAAINSIIKEAEIKSDATISVIAGKLEDPLTLKTQNEKKAFLEECRDGFLQYYNDPTNPIYDYDVSNLDKLSNALSNQYQITIPDTFFTDDPQKYVSHIIFNAIANKLAIRKIIKFYTDKIEGLDKSQSTFDKSTLSQIFWPDAVSKFEEIEKQLWEHGYFTDLGAWKKKTITVTLTDLVKLIILLKEYGYFKKIGEGSKKLKETDYRAFFEKRYDCNINQQFSNRNIHDTGSIAQLFPFVKLLDIA